MIVFLALCGLSVVFLVYVLANFGKEARRMRQLSESAGRRGYRWSPAVVTVTLPISHCAQGGISVLPLNAFADAPRQETPHSGRRAQVLKMPLKPAPIDGRRPTSGAKVKAR